MRLEIFSVSAIVIALVGWIWESYRGGSKDGVSRSIWIPQGLGLTLSILLPQLIAFGLFAFVVYVSIAGTQQRQPLEAEAMLGLLIGFLVVHLAEEAEARWGKNLDFSIMPFALGIGGVTLIFLGASTGLPMSAMAMTIPIGGGLGAAVMTLSDKRMRGRWASYTALSAALMSFAYLLALKRPEDNAIAGMTTLGLTGVALSLIVSTHIPSKVSVWLKLPVNVIRGIGFFVLFGLFAYFIGTRMMQSAEFAWLALGGAFASVLTAWMLSDEENATTGTIGLSALVWVFATTLAFGWMKGYGVAILLIGALCMFFVMGSRRALLPMGAGFAILMYRVFLDYSEKPDASLEIGQNYALIGVLFGALVPLTLLEWGYQARKKFSGFALASLGVVAGVVVSALIVILIFVLDFRGAVGWMAGLSVAPVIQALRNSMRPAILSIIATLGAANILAYQLLQPQLGMERDAKIKLVVWVVVGVIALIVVSGLIAKKNPEGEHL